MDRFLGRHQKRIDAKGRVSIPAPFRAVIARDGFEGLYCVRSLWHPAVDAGGAALIAEIDKTLAVHDTFSPEHLALSTALMGASDTLGFDGEGRIMMPDWLKQAIGASDEVVFVGQGIKFQIWAPERFAAFEEKAREEAARLIAARSSAGGRP